MNDTDGMSRKERRELHRMQRRQDGQAFQQSKTMKRIIVWGIAILLLGAIGWLAWAAAQRAPAGTAGTLTVPVSETDNVSGPADAPVTLVEYADFQCPGCAAFHPVIQQTLADAALAGKVRFVYRNFPLTNIHPNALLAARSAQAAGAQGKFWEMHDAIFESQATWSRLSTSAAHNTFAGYAQEIGLDTEQWESDLDSDAVKSKVDADVASGLQAGVNSTPSFFVNGTYLDVFAATDVVGAFRQALIDAVNATP